MCIVHSHVQLYRWFELDLTEKFLLQKLETIAGDAYVQPMVIKHLEVWKSIK